MNEIGIRPICGLPELREGDDLAEHLAVALRQVEDSLQDGDVVVVTQKAVSKVEGRVVKLDTVLPGTFARRIAAEHDKDPRALQLVLDETVRIVRMVRGILICQTRHGFICANAGVDRSNVASDSACLLPLDPDASAAKLRNAFVETFGVQVAVIISDTFGRPWRNGQTNVAIGIAGMEALDSYVGQHDKFANELHVTQIAVADELAAAAELVMRKLDGVPAAVVRGFTYKASEEGRARALVRPPERDLFL